MWKSLTSKTIYIQPGNLVLSCCRIKLLYFQKGGFMFKDIQLNCANFSTEMINDTDLESLKKSFVDVLTHDLKTPILAQIRVLEMLVEEQFGSLNNEQQEMLNLTLESCNYMYAMVATLISTYKFDIEAPELNYSNFNIMQIIENAIKKTKSFLQENNIKVVVIPEIKNPIISGDVIRLTKVIHTLLFNSLNSAFKNSIMKIYLEEDNTNISVKFESRSGYITPEKMRKRFQIHTYHNQKYDKIGTGIGLYLVNKIIEKHHGKIIAESSITQKNILGFQIPIAAPNEFYYENCV